MLGFALHLNERIARHEHVGVQMHAAVCRVSEVADLACVLEGAADEVAASLHMSRPGEDVRSKLVIDSGLETPQSALLDQVAAEPTEPKCSLVVAEEPTGDRAKPFINGTRTIAVAVLEAEIDRLTESQEEEVHVRERCRRPELD